MNQTPSLLERLSPRPMVCPLIRLGRNSPPPPTEQSSQQSDRPFHASYMSYYESASPNRTYLDSEYPQNYRAAPHQQLPGKYPKAANLDLSLLSLGASYWEHENYSKLETSQSDSNSSPEYQQETNYLLDNFAKLGKSSPSLDQGYHTLVSPSPGLSTPGHWKVKKLQAKNNSFDRLPDDLIVRVFSFLTSSDLSVCARVCRRFDALVWTPTLWRTILLEGETISGDRAIRGVLRQLCGQGRTGACPSIEKVYLANGAKITDRGLSLLAKRCPELTHLKIQGSTSVTNGVFFEILARCTNLQHLDITGCVQITCANPSPSSEPLRRLQLQYLDLTDCPALYDNGLRVIVRNCPQLSYLYLRRCIQITDAGLKFVPSFCSGLRELSVSDCSNITDFGLYELAKLGATLRYLSVAKCDRVSDAGLKVIARRCYKLRYLNVRGCEAVSDDAITVLARSCTRLRALDIGKCDVSDAGLRALAESCPNLKKLSLRNCDLVTDRGVQCVAYYCRGLQQLNIQDCQISLEGYRAVKKYCKRCVIEHTNPGFF
ncbi:F-box/LRR-repeat protein 7 [Onthophagus taurus]|uniref:F-box/LRR-repeat protein 7 n=1 Tax=Onthophagus taurus TaxID=166361 RepID=UPI000C20C104|nr:F-box/LRR-repeat protein 7 [Onthophagus taurus]